jgi:membrane protease YdiL (CAAX protease family)
MAVLSYALFGSTQRELAILLGSLAIFVTTCFFAVRYWPSLAVQFKQVGFNTAAAWIGLLLLAPLLAINYGYHSFIFKLAGHEVEAANDLHKLAISNVGLVILICVFPAILEEIAFRGLVQHWLTTAIGPAKAMLLASAMFTALHFSIISAPYLFMVGMLLAWTKWKSKSLYPCMLIHFLHNFVVIQYF